MKINLKNELCFRSIKILDIGYTSFVAIILGLIFAFISDAIFGKYDREYMEKKIKENKNYRFVLGIRLMLVAFYSGTLVYIFRNVIELIPSPFDGICSFEHRRLKELSSIPFTIFVLFFIYQFDIFSHTRDEFKTLLGY